MNCGIEESVNKVRRPLKSNNSRKLPTSETERRYRETKGEEESEHHQRRNKIRNRRRESQDSSEREQVEDDNSVQDLDIEAMKIEMESTKESLARAHEGCYKR
ncbi:predicted protein [Arabidopsis lyrata subsp. lyrata]|uniref:Predicted protein n=1 Tax=Arabidopsis lyrata subsp. lyrata TaxID=81972 RepID=D7MGF7_ARALL|nr:predicted protein [Arabidopsis lyrata subsp. lyrata]